MSAPRPRGLAATAQPPSRAPAAAAAANAYQSVAQSAAISIQDGADNLRNLMAISTTAIGVAMAKYIETQNAFYLEVITNAQNLVQTGTEQLAAIGKAAAGVVDGFPDGG